MTVWQPWCAKRCMRACAALCVSHLALTASKERVFFYFTKNDPEELPGRRRLQRRFRDLVIRDRCLRPSEEHWQYLRLDIYLLVFFQPFFDRKQVKLFLCCCVKCETVFGFCVEVRYRNSAFLSLFSTFLLLKNFRSQVLCCSFISNNIC